MMYRVKQFLGLLDPEEGGTTILQNVDDPWPVDVV
jgi:hypothetical protein